MSTNKQSPSATAKAPKTRTSLWPQPVAMRFPSMSSWHSASSGAMRPCSLACTSFWKYFCAWLRICTSDRVLIILEIFFHSFPCTSRPCRKSRCSSCVHRPVGGGVGVEYGGPSQ